MHSNIYSHVADEESPDNSDDDSSEETPPFKSGQSRKKEEWIKNDGWGWEKDEKCRKRPVTNMMLGNLTGEENYRLCKARNIKRKFCRDRCHDDACNSHTKRKRRIKKMCQGENAFPARGYMKKYNIWAKHNRWAKFKCGTCRLIFNNAWHIN